MKKDVRILRVLNWRDARLIITTGEIFDPSDEDSISRTVPDGSLTIADLMARYTRGQTVPGDIKDESGYESPGDVPEDLPDFSKMDKFEKMDMKREIDEQVKETTDKLKKRDKVIDELDKKVKRTRKKKVEETASSEPKSNTGEKED